jgi:hypothetical protein
MTIWKPNKILNGKSWRWGDLYDSWNQTQKDHFDGIVDVYAPQPNGMPSIAQQWKEDYKRRHRK